MAECVFKWVKDGDVMIGVNTTGKISDEDWSAFMAEFGASDYKIYMGFSLGILEVSSAQRKQSAAAIRENGTSVIVITDEVLVRGIVTAVSWLGANVKSFPWRDVDRALQYADLEDHKTKILAQVDSLRDEVTALDDARRKKRREQMKM